ncbi:MAG: DUF1573 domain-containing protein [Candidatus Andersenbacteria bacterium]
MQPLRPARHAWLVPTLGFVGVVGALFFLGWRAQTQPSNRLVDQPAISHAQPAASSSTPTALTVDAALFDFGTVAMSKGKVTHDFVVTNTGKQPISLTKLYTSCMCTSAELSLGEHHQGPFGMQGHGATPTFDETLAPGAAVTVSATFDPNAHGPAGVGPIDRSVSLESSDGVLALRFTGTVTP